MHFPMEAQDSAAISRQYTQNMCLYPIVKEEVDAFLRDKEDDFILCMQYLYGHMAAQDVLSTDPKTIAEYVHATLEALQVVDYLKNVPAKIFFPYVLYHRVNSECLDDSRPFLLKQLLPFVKGKSMKQAALSVNYWCYAHATYTPADDRTLGPMAVLRRTLGRCGEESVLAVAALRSVGIPARQCYCPRWSHCDDNHAWVELWIEGDWHYLGACEPEPILDRGWFTAAASRAMLVDTKCWAGDSLYEAVHYTSRYTTTRILTVSVTENGLPVAGSRVQFQIVNYSELYTLWETQTDENGLARFETGPGDLLVCARYGNQAALGKADLRLQDSISLELTEGFPEQLHADLVPPEDTSGAVPYEDTPHHALLLRHCEAHLAARRSSFAAKDGYWYHAGMNGVEIQAFLEDDRWPHACKEELLATLRPKDFADITAQTLADALEAADSARDQFPEDIFRSFILAPRVADEMLLPERLKIRALFPDGFSAPEEILSWMLASMQLLSDNGITNYYPSAYGCLRCRQVPEFAFDMVFVALCRAFRFPARLEPATGFAQWMDRESIWHSIRPEKAPVALNLEIPRGKKLNYSEHITLARWNGSDFSTLRYPDLTVEGCHTFQAEPGYYRITVTTRQIDGTASVSLWHLTLSGSRTLAITPPEDQTAQRLKQIPLRLPDGPLLDTLRKDPGRNLVLIFANPGSEPTEHLLREMMELGKDFRSLPCRILLAVENAEALRHPTMQLWKAALPEAEALCLHDPHALTALHRQMQVGDLRLPFVVCADNLGRGIYADANYRIRMAQTLLDIQSLLR